MLYLRPVASEREGWNLPPCFLSLWLLWSNKQRRVSVWGRAGGRTKRRKRKQNFQMSLRKSNENKAESTHKGWHPEV